MKDFLEFLLNIDETELDYLIEIATNLPDNISDLVRALSKLSNKCKKERIDVFIEILKIHTKDCIDCDLKKGIRKLKKEW